MLFRSRKSVCLLVACFTAGMVCHSRSAFGDDPPTQLAEQADWEARIAAALEAKGDWEFRDVPLQEVCAAMQEALGIDVVLDIPALEDYGIDPRTPITRAVGGISNRSFLRVMLNDLELCYTTRLGALWITTHEYAESQLTTKVHPVGDLLVRDARSGERAGDHKLLVQAIRGNIAPDSWDEVGGPAAIEGIRDAIVVAQTSDIHEQIEQFLATYRALIASDTGAEEPVQTVFMVGEKLTSVIRAALDQPLTADFQQAPLREVADSIAAAINIPIVIDVRALEDFGIDASTPVSHRFTKTPLRFALGRLLYELELTYTLRDEVLLITTPEEAEAELLIGLYPVRDLVEIGDGSAIEPLGARCDFDSLTNLIHSIVRPDSWDEVGGPSSLATLLPVPTIVIAQTQEVHEEIAELLAKLRAAKQLEAAQAVPREDADPAALIVRSYPIYAALHSSDELAKLVIRACEPGTWHDEVGTFVQGLGPSLVVKHNVSGHRQVQKLLADLGILSPASRGKPWLGGGSFKLEASPQTVAPSGGGGFF